MKKLNKILAAISTAALTFCVWGTQTQAKVVYNKQYLPTHIEADNEEEFFRDLTLVLHHIELRLVVAGETPHIIHELFLKKQGLTKETENSLPSSDYTNKQYNYALKPGPIHINIAEGYLYSLLLKSKINNLEIKNVYQLRLDVPQFIDTEGIGEIIFSLPANENVYYTPNLRWHLWVSWKKERPLHPGITTFRESITNPVQFLNSFESIGMWIYNTSREEITSYEYSQADLSEHADTIIQKLISIAGLTTENEEMEYEFSRPTNSITDYNEFAKAKNKNRNISELS